MDFILTKFLISLNPSEALFFSSLSGTLGISLDKLVLLRLVLLGGLVVRGRADTGVRGGRTGSPGSGSQYGMNTWLVPGLFAV